MNELLWVERYRPKKIKDCILPQDLKTTFQAFVNNKQIPNLILTGPPGVGKTSVAKAMVEEVGCDYIMINASLDRNIDTLRTKIAEYASSMSFYGTRKYVILDEADYLNPNSFQPALRNFLESFSKNCGFLFTVNYLHKLIEPLHSRVTVVDFKFQNSEKPKLAAKIFKRCIEILNLEKIKYEEDVIAQLVQKWFPDCRRIINELQRYSATGRIDSGILTNFQEIVLKDLMTSLKEKNFTKVRSWIAQHSDLDVNDFYTKLFEHLPTYLSKIGFANAILILAKYQYESSFSVNQEINKSACLVEMMIQLDNEWK